MFNSPMSVQRADQLINALDLSPDKKSNVIDFGCGDGLFLRRIASQKAISGIGIDNNEKLIEEVNSLNKNPDIRFICTDAAQYTQNLSPVDTIICIGSEFIFGGYQSLLSTAKNLLNDRGQLLVGTIYWKQEPTSDYLSLLDDQNPYFMLPETVEQAYEAGYLPLAVYRSNDDEWDTFESYHSRKRYLAALESNVKSLQDATWQWQNGYLNWGMATMGFCFLVLQKM